MSFKIPLETELLIKTFQTNSNILGDILFHIYVVQGFQLVSWAYYVLSIAFPFPSGLTHLYVYVYVSEAHPNE